MADPRTNPEKKITFDRYHVTRLVVDAVDKVRIQEHRALMEEGNAILKGTKLYQPCLLFSSLRP